MLDTSTFSTETVRALQRKLYLKAKHQSDFRFYSLYDKVYRSDVLQRAYDLVKKNNMEERLRLHLRYRHKVTHRGAAYTRFARGYLYDNLGLYSLPLNAAWKGVHA